ncbi:MAG TPA: hypothetical protein VG675_22310 [Bryobacteraceae bacterium]|nr:hypothetical protein [Bryobacteraceae bacterium]
MHRIILVFMLVAGAFAQPRNVTYETLANGQRINGFRTAALYLDDAGRVTGARFLHERSGFTLDLLAIQSVPQAFIWVTTYPTSDMGEPHTQEHLLLGKGVKGRALGSQELMSLVSSSAFTAQWLTCFDFYTAAGPDVFYRHFERTMDALLHPDYTDEEVRREVRNFGVSSDPKTGVLSLEEKGTVYNEMVTSMDQASYRLYHAAKVALYGAHHPLAYESGGMPAALRVLQPADIRRFHDEHYFLANMGLIAALPKEMTLPAALARFDEALRRLEPRKPALAVTTEAELPAPQPAPAGRIEYVNYPFGNDQQASSVMLLWPPDRKLSNRDQTLAGLFFDTLAGDPDTNLYKLLIDSRTRVKDFGAKSVGSFVDTDQGNPVFVVFGDVPAARLNDRDLGDLRTRVMEELARIAAWKDGSPELIEFNTRLKSRIVEQRRALAKFVDSPPGFGFRTTGPDWIVQLHQLNKEGGFQKSLTQKPDLAAIEQLVSSGRNLWRDYLAQWKITGVVPYIEAAKPDPSLVRAEAQERAARVTAEEARLKTQYGAAGVQQALRDYRADYDKAGAAIERAASEITPPKFLDNPPMTLDDQLEFKATKLAGGVPLVTSTFDTMASATTGIDLRLDGVPEDRLVYLSMLPQLLTRVGVIENGRAISYEEMTGRLRNEILSLNAGFSINDATNRYELVMRGAGNNAAESQRAIEWMKLALFHPDWRPENLPRIRDLVDQTLGILRNTTQSPEERWVNDPALAYRRQGNPLLLATASFMTRAHNVFRLRWMLKDGAAADIDAFLDSLAHASGTREERKARLAAIENGTDPAMNPLSDSSKTLAVDAAKDLEIALADIPDSSLAADWSALCGEMKNGLAIGPRRTLAELDAVRRSILISGGARLFLIASPASQRALAGDIEGLATSLTAQPLQKAVYHTTLRVDARLAGRDSRATHPIFVALVNPNSQGGVFLNSAPLASYHDTSRDKLLDYLASNLYAGHGAHGIFMKTWAAGLAYSNGIRVRLGEGRINYYAERTPVLPQTLKFVIDDLKGAQPNPSLNGYAIAGAFDGTRSASRYEVRGEAMADDLADGLTPDVVRRFHQAILDLRRDPDLTKELFVRMGRVYATVLPGMGIKANSVLDGVYLVIGPEKQLAAYEQYLKTAEGPDTVLFRLYPRDFWMTN